MLFLIEGDNPDIRPTSRHAIVTMAVGPEYVDLWMRVARPSWLAYAARHDIDVIVIMAPLDVSTRAAGRSPAWQKCLILSQPWSGLYERIAWVDADIIMNQFAPSIFEQGVPTEMVGGVLAGGHLSSAERHILMEKDNILAPAFAADAKWQAVQNDIYRRQGIKTDLGETVSTGVLVLSPAHHGELLKTAYGYEDCGNRSYEQASLSLLILSNGLLHQISARFNWVIWERMWICRNGKLSTSSEEDFYFVQNEMAISYFLHFALANHIMIALRTEEIGM